MVVVIVLLDFRIALTVAAKKWIVRKVARARGLYVTPAVLPNAHKIWITVIASRKSVRFSIVGSTVGVSIAGRIFRRCTYMRSESSIRDESCF